MRRGPLAVVLFVVLTPLAAAETTVLLDGRDVADAGREAPVRVDPHRPVRLDVVFRPPQGTTLEARSVVLGLVATGEGTPPVVRRTLPAGLAVPGGTEATFTDEVDPSPLAALGSGLFLVQVEVLDGAGETVHATTFYVRVPGSPFLTVLGAIATVASVAAGYGLWRLLQDLKELKDAWDRHHAQEEDGREPLGRADLAAKAFLDEAARVERWWPMKWGLTGLGVGGVAVAWAQAFGWLPFDLVDLALVAGAVASVLLAFAVIAAALVRRMRAGAPKPT